jgi:hypothetical protein
MLDISCCFLILVLLSGFQNLPNKKTHELIDIWVLHYQNLVFEGQNSDFGDLMTSFVRQIPELRKETRQGPAL